MNNRSVQVFLGLGSNTNSVKNIKSALTELRKYFGELKLSPVYSSPPLKNSGENYLNLVVSFYTDRRVDDLLKLLKTIEDSLGRERVKSESKTRDSEGLEKKESDGNKRITIDLDVLIYADLLGEVEGKIFPHRDILDCPYVLKPFSELAPKLIHPVENVTILELWQRYSSKNISWLNEVDLD